MKLENCVIVTKGACLCYIPLATALAAGLPELGVTVLFGLPIKFWVLAVSATVAGASGLLGFISTSFSQYMAGRPPQDPKP